MGTVWFGKRVGNKIPRQDVEALRRCHFWKGNPIFVMDSPFRRARRALFQGLSRALPIVCVFAAMDYASTVPAGRPWSMGANAAGRGRRR